MEYIKEEKGFVPLQKKNVDFGGGLERLAAVTENKSDIFQTDVFLPCIQMLEKETGIAYENEKRAFRIITDHLRSALFILADGVRPSNTDQGYLLRRLLRAALYHLHYTLKAPQSSVTNLFPAVAKPYEKQYPETQKSELQEVVQEEEERFKKTLGNGIKIFTHKGESGLLKGEEVFDLQTTYGFPKELTIALAEEKGIKVDLTGYEEAMRQHKEASRSGGEKKFKGGLGDTDEKSVRYHTATHLLHKALRDVLGEQVEQKGSNITPERMRFDFSHTTKLTDEEKQRVETLVNEKIQEDLPVTYKDMSKEEAEALGAIGLFTYENKVRVYCIG